MIARTSFEIPSAHYDGLIHTVPFSIGNDFIAKYDAYRDDGFAVQTLEGRIRVFKAMPGEMGIPEAADEGQSQ